MRNHTNQDQPNAPFVIYGESSYSEHVVQDARSRTNGMVEPSQKESKKPHSKGKTILLTAMITLLAFSLTLVAADLIGNGSGIKLYTSIFKKEYSHSVTYYAVYATHSSDMAVSYKNAAAVREEGGAGYVLKDEDEYYVVLNVYDDEEQAKSVSERKANYAILELNVPDFDVKKQPTLSPAESSKDLYKEAYETLYNAANALASGKYAKQDMKRTLQTFKEKAIAVENNYSERIGATEDTCAIEYKVILAEIRSAFENLEQNDSHLVADARYYAVMIVRSYALFAQKYFS